MKALKVLGTIILGWFLLVSLVILGAVLTLQGTLLNADFVAGQAEKADLVALAREITEEQIGDRLSPQDEFVIEAVYTVVAGQEPWLKRQLDSAIHEGYDFFLGRTDRLLIAVSLQDLKLDMKESLWKSVTEDPGAWLPLFQDDLNAYVDQHFAALVLEVKQDLPQPLDKLPVEALRPALQKYLLDLEDRIARQDLPPGAYDLILVVARPYFDDYYDELVIDIPDEIAFDSGDVPEDTMATLLSAREYIGYFRTGFYLLIAFAVLLAGGIVLVWRAVRPACLALGIVLVVAGGLELTGVLYAWNALPAGLLTDVPASLVLSINNSYHAVLSVARLFSIGVLAAGIILLAVSVLYRRGTSLD
jgi:hypothetical protein